MEFDSQWRLGKGGKRVLARDETLRDGNQSEVPRSAARAVAHIIDQCHIYDVMTLGWIYTSPTDVATAKYLRQHGEELAKKLPGFDKNKFLIYSLVYRGDAKTPEEVDPNDPFGFGKMLREMQSRKQPYGNVNILTKARCKDLEDLGLNSESLQKDLANTAHLIKQANPDITVEIALEHFYTAWLEADNQAANRKHIIDTIVTGLLAAPGQEGGVRITAPDTDGAHAPNEITQVIHDVTIALQHDERLTGAHPPIHFDPSVFIAHMHDDLGNAAANTRAALEAGAGSFDSTAGIMGERRGNVTTAAMAEELDHPNVEAISKYQAQLAVQLGLKPGDKPIGSPEAQCAVGGMHGHALLLALRAAQAKGMDYDEFVRTYGGSYASAHPEGVPLQATLSPVAGAANVLFMLSGLGLDLDDKKDPRIAEVLAEVKNGEFERGMNYRGYNNANAMLLLADKFGLREHMTPGRTAKSRNHIQLSFAPQWEPEEFMRDVPTLGKLSLLSGTTPESPMEWSFICPHRNEGFARPDGHQGPGFSYSGISFMGHDRGGFALDAATGMLYGAEERLVKVDKRFGDVGLQEVREFEAPLGAVHAKGGNPLDPHPEKVPTAVKLIFTTGTKEQFQANGVGKTHEEALGMAIQTMLDFQCFQIERERKKEGRSPILDVSLAREHLNSMKAILADKSKLSFGQR